MSRGQFYYAKGWIGGNTGDNETAKFIAALSGIGILAILVIIGGVGNGIYAHILLTTGYDISSNETVMLSVFNVTCNTLSTLPNTQQSSSICHQTYSEAKSEVNLDGFIEFILPMLALIAAIAVLIGGLGDSPWLFVVGAILGVIYALLLSNISYNVGFALMGGTSNIPTHTTSIPTTSTTSTRTTTSSTTTTINA